MNVYANGGNMSNVDNALSCLLLYNYALVSPCFRITHSPSYEMKKGLLMGPGRNTGEEKIDDAR